MRHQENVRVSVLATGIESRIDEACRRIGGRAAAAAAAGVSDDMLRRYVRGDSKPTFDVIAKLARAADVSLDWIASGSDGSTTASQGGEEEPRDEGVPGTTKGVRSLAKAESTVKEDREAGRLDDAELVRRVVLGIGKCEEMGQVRFTPGKRAAMAALLFRYFQQEGTMDQAKLEELLRDAL